MSKSDAFTASKLDVPFGDTTQCSSIDGYTITWTANEPTAGYTATIADGDVPTVAELGQAVADLTNIVNQLVAMVANT